MLPKVYIPRGVEYHVISVRRIIKEYGPSCGLVIELRRIISNPKWTNAWLAIERGEYGWYMIKIIFGKTDEIEEHHKNKQTNNMTA